MQCPRCQHENPAGQKYCGECGTPLQHLEENVQPATSYAELQHSVTESLEQQTATAEILKAISRSTFDLQPVFDTMAENAVRLCEAERAFIFQFDGALLRAAASYNVGTEVREFVYRNPIALGRHSISARAALERRTVHIPDVRADPDYAYAARDVDLIRTMLAVPMLKGEDLFGTITIYRLEVKPFTDKQISLVETFADQAVIAIENVRLFKELETRNRDLTEALEQQTATAEILRVISQSPTDVQPVFQTILDSAKRLLGAFSAMVVQRAGDELHLAALSSVSEAGDARVRQAFPIHIAEPSTAPPIVTPILTRQPFLISDAEAQPDVDDTSREVARARGYRSQLVVPLRREQSAIGVISVTRREAGGFTQDEVALLQTFADQAVIAIENVRLFNELQEKNRALTESHAQVTEALEQQTATGEILRVISRSQTDVQPVFDSIAESSLRLCGALFSSVYRFDGELVHMVAQHNYPPAALELSQRVFPARPSRQLFSARAILERAVVHVADILADENYAAQELVQSAGFRSALAVPMMRGAEPIGAIGVWHADVGPFTDKHIALLKTFADQAVIAIENVRLFKELEEKNRALTEAHAQVTESLEQQTATAEILRAISSSPTDVQPVFDTIARSALRLCEGGFAVVCRYDGDLLHLAAHSDARPEGVEVMRRLFPMRPNRINMVGRAILTGAVAQVVDANADREYGREFTASLGNRTSIGVPMLRDGRPIGAIMVGRLEVRPFSDVQIALLRTFADQAVIAIENVRLFKELEARTASLTSSVEQLTALGEVGRAVSSTIDLETVLQTIVTRANHLTGTAGCTIWEYDEPREEFRLRVSHYADETDAPVFQAIGRVTTIRKGQGVTTQVMEQRQPVQIPDISVEGAYESAIRGPLIEAGHRALLGVPLLSEDEVIGVLAVTRKTPGVFEPEIVRLLSTFATQSALAIQNARLFREIEDKSRQLEAASRHKSEFLANMSHELRTPLNAVIGFSEVLIQRMFGALNDKQDEYLKDIYASGQHLLSLINDILDLSKIEAGRMELAPAPFHLPTALENAVTLVRERAARHGITLALDVDPTLGGLVGDERKVKQVLLNLLSNAVKFTPEGGRISVKAGLTDGAVAIAVTDTGIGIAPEDQAAIFEEFRQVGSDETRKQEGTGLGLTLAKKFAELHGGRIWVESELGTGSTFTFTLPVS